MVKKRLFSLKDNILKMLCNEINLVLLLKIRFLFLTQKIYKTIKKAKTLII